MAFISINDELFPQVEMFLPKSNSR